MNRQMPTPQNQQPIQIPSPLSQNEMPKEKKGILKALALLEIGLIEIFFVSIVLVLIFGILNYFNILPLSKLLPNQLGFLPHQKQNKSNLTIKQFNNVDVTIVPTIAPAVPLTDQGEFSSQAKQTLTNFLPTILAPDVVPEPSQITLEQDKNLATTFIGSWDTKESTGAAILIVTDGKSISQFYLSVPIFHTMPPSINLASTITPQFFSIKPKGKWGCKPLSGNNTYCENFWEENDGTRRGLGMQGLFTQEPNLVEGQPTAMLIFCEHTKESKLYSWKSCQFEFAKSGVVQ